MGNPLPSTNAESRNKPNAGNGTDGKGIRAMERNGTTYHAQTPAAVVDALERARLSGERVRLFYGDTETGRAWAEEHDVSGTVSRSMGPVKIPLLIANKRAHGGAGILDHCIVAIQLGAGRFAYRHPTFNPGAWCVRASDLPDYAAAVTHDGEIHARFKTDDAAARYAGFMRGERFSK